MAKIHHVQYMQKSYGGSETLISLVASHSKHSHNVGYARDKSRPDPETPSYIRIIEDFRAYFKDPDLKDMGLMHTHFVFPGHFSQEAGLSTVCSSHCLFSEEFKLAAMDSGDLDEISELLESHAYFANLENELYPNILTLVAHSAFHKQELEERGCNPVLLELPVEVSKFDLGLPRHEAREAIGLPDKFTILFLGRPTYLKGFSVLAKAFQDLLGKKDCQLLVVGDFELRGNYLAYSPCVRTRESSDERAFLYVGDNVFVKPSVGHNSIPLYYNAADVLVCPSFYEALGYVNLEAMASGTLVIGSDSTGIPYIVENMETGLLFRTGDPEDLASKLALTIEDQNLVKTITGNAREFVQRFDVTNVLPEYENFYDSLMERSLWRI